MSETWITAHPTTGKPVLVRPLLAAEDRDLQLPQLLSLYKPNVGNGNFDAPRKAANEMLVLVAQRLGIATDSEMRGHFRALDGIDWEESEARLARINAR